MPGALQPRRDAGVARRLSRDVFPATGQLFTGWARVLLADLIRSVNEARVRRYVKQLVRDILRPFGGDRFSPGPMRIVGRAQGDLDAAP
jgi:hypothetical protein